MEKEIKLLNIKKTSAFKNVPPKNLKSNAHNCYETLTKLFNDTANNDEFQGKLKLAQFTTIFKKDDPTKSKSYRPVRVLRTVSKVFERMMHRQMSIFVRLHVWVQQRF